MAFDIGDVDLRVRTVEDRIGPDQLEDIVREVMRRLSAAEGKRAEHDRDVAVWRSVREAGGGS